MTNSTRAAKSPINLLIGRTVRDVRVARGVSESAFGSEMHLEESYIRGIEAGSFKCPADKAHTLSRLLGWQFQSLATLLISATVLEGKKSNVQDSIAEKTSTLIQLAPEFIYVWEWCRSMRITSLKQSELLTLPVSEWKRKNHLSAPIAEFEKVAKQLKQHLSEGHTNMTIPIAPRYSPFFIPAFEGFARALEVLSDTLQHAAPVVNFAGLRHFGTRNALRIKGVKAFLSYLPTPSEFGADTFSWDFLFNTSSPMIDLYLTKQYSTQLESSLNLALKGRFKSQKLTRDCVRLHKAPSVFNGPLYFDVANRRVAMEKVSPSDMEFKNAWIYNMQAESDDVFLAMLDNYEQNVEKSVFGASLDAIESSRFHGYLLGTPRT